MSRHPFLTALAILLALTVFITWPQCLFLASKVSSHNDPYFSAWRLAWIAHALPENPRHLFDGNVFYPARLTLAYSDATLLEGIIAAPLLWAGVPLILVYNLSLLLGGFVASGLGMFVLVRDLTRSDRAAVVSAAIFTFAPYRIEHYMHLELQWAAWIPLAFWAVHRAVDRGSWRYGVLAGLFMWLQIVSCVYYGVFLALVLPVLASLTIAAQPRKAPAAFAGLALGAIVAAALTIPYSRPYLGSMQTVGTRDLSEIAHFSALPMNYLASPPHNWLWGWTAGRFGSAELRLFPGVIAAMLVVLGLAARPRRLVWIYLAVAALSVDLSLGFNGFVYPWLHAHVALLRGLRVPARSSVLVLCALGVLGGLGFSYLERRRASSGGARGLLAGALMLIALDYASAPIFLESVPKQPPDVYRVVKDLDPGVIVELPMPRPERMPWYEAQYMFWSTTHWRPLVNGYSGYVPPDYIRTLEQMRTFPDDLSIWRLRALGVRYVVVHEALFEDAKERAEVLIRMGERPELTAHGRYRDWIGETRLFELRR